MGSYATLAGYEPLVRGSMADIMQNSNLAAEVSLRQAEEAQQRQSTEQTRLLNEQTRLTLADQMRMRQIFSDPKLAPQVFAGDLTPLTSAGINPQTALTVGATLNEYKKNLMANTLEQNKVQAEAVGKIADMTFGAKSLVGPNGEMDAVNSALRDGFQRFAADGTFTQAGVPVPDFQPLSRPEDLDRLYAGTLAQKALHDKVVSEQQASAGEKKTEAETKNLGAEAEKNTAQAKQAETETGIKQAQLNAIKNLPPVGDPRRYTTVDSQVTDPDLRTGARAAYDGMLAAGELPAEALKAVAPFAEKQNQRNTETNPAILKARRDQAVQTEVQKNLEMARRSPELFGGIIDAVERRRAEDDYAKINNEYADTMAAVGLNKQLIDATLAGNKASGAIVPISELRQFLNRVNGQELKAISSQAGNAADRLEGLFSKYASKSGVPVSADVLRDMKAVADAQAASATGKAQQKLAVLKATHQLKQDLPLVQLPGAATQQTQYLRFAQGPNNHQIGQKADGGWYDVVTGQKIQ